MQLSERISTVLHLDPTAPAVEYHGEWTTWRELGVVADSVTAAVRAAETSTPVAVGILLSNRPEIVGAALGVLLGDDCIVTLNPHQGDAGLAADLRELSPPVIVATTDDWQRPAVANVARELGLAGIAVTMMPEASAHAVHQLERTTATAFRSADPGVAVEMLTSGTTGPPKRVPLRYSAFERTITAAGQHYRTGGAEVEPAPTLRSGVALVTSPLVHMSGIFRMLLNICEGRRIALLERFRVQDWVDLVQRHKPRAVSLVPTALAMVYEAGVSADVFESIEVVTSGSAALDPDLQQRFEERYRVAVLPSYGATEFAGGVAGWTLPLHREWIDRKRGSAGRPQPGRQLRVVVPETGEPVAPGGPGILEVRSADTDWVRTTDLARIDQDGFVWIDGRTDDAIVRGGFKIFPKEVVEVLKSHPAVLDAGVVGLPDERLGQVPVAAVELRPGRSAEPDDLITHVAEHLTGYKVPRQVLVVDRLPRTPSLKVSGPGVQGLFDESLNHEPQWTDPDPSEDSR